MITSPSLSTAGVTSFLGLRPGFGLAGMTHSLDATIRRLIRNGSVRSHQPSQGINSTYQSPIKWRKKKRQQRQRRWWWWKVHSFERGVEVEQQRRVTGADGELKRGGFLSYGKRGRVVWRRMRKLLTGYSQVPGEGNKIFWSAWVV